MDCAECTKPVEVNDYLCKTHRLKVDGVTICKECSEHYTTDKIKTHGQHLCPECRVMLCCESCSSLYHPATNKRWFRLKGLCFDCKTVAEEGIYLGPVYHDAYEWYKPWEHSDIELRPYR